MAIDLDDPELAAEEAAPESDSGKTPADGSPPEAFPSEDTSGAERPSLRLALAVAFPTVACAVMVGGIFSGVPARPVAAIAGILGIGLALGVSRMPRRPLLSYALIGAGLFAIGLVMLLPNVANVVHVSQRIREATKASSVLQPPVRFDPGWRAIVGWIMGLVGFGAGWTALEIKWRSTGLVLPLPIAAVAAISVPKAVQVPSGIVVMVLFAVGLGIVSSEQATGDEDVRPSVGYEVRKALKALPVIALITGLLVVLAQTKFLFPEPVYNPAQQAQRPKAQPLSAVEDRVLFEIVDSELTGPFRMGTLDVYDPSDGSWRLPPFAQASLREVPASGIVDPDLKERQDLHATFVVRGLGGAVLPALANSVGIAARGPRLAWDARSGNIRLVNGQAHGGFTYTVTAAGLPSEAQLVQATFANIPREVGQFLNIPPPPPAVASLIDRAPQASRWERFNWLRQWVLDNVTAKGMGTPVDMPPSRVADMVAGSRQGSPFEIVAAQAMLARWVGIPARIGYGFDGGEKVGDALQIRPRNGATWVEVWFPGFKWLPVIGTPRRAEASVNNDPSKQLYNPNIKPSNNIAAQLYLPVLVPPRSQLAKRIGLVVLGSLPILLLGGLAYAIWPAFRKLRLRARRRAAAVREGTRARVALAYAEWRDYAADLGYPYITDTPLQFLERFVPDEEHTELAWLATRVLWGDLRDDPPPEAATAAEELSRSLRRRFGSVQPATMRAVALVSRVSLRHPYAPEPSSEPGLDRTEGRELVPA